MNETMSLLLATTVLALGGLGLYMFKSPDDKDVSDDEYNEDGLFGSGSLFNWNKEKDDKDDFSSDESESEEEDYRPRKKQTKTHKNRKTAGNSRRKY